MNEQQHIAETLVRIHKEGLVAALVTVIEVSGSVPRQAGSKMIVWPDGGIEGTIGGGKMESEVVQSAIEAIRSGKSTTGEFKLIDPASGDPGVCGGTVRIFVEPLLHAPALLVIGLGHVGKALAELGKWTGFRVVVSDDREEFCNESYLPGMDGYVLAPPAQVVEQARINNRTFVAAVTRGLPVDEKLIPALLETEAPYIGVIGSRRRWALTVQALEEKGISREKLEQIHAPIGLELQAETPREIALSIMAEVLAIYRGGNARPMQWLGSVADGVTDRRE